MKVIKRLSIWIMIMAMVFTILPYSGPVVLADSTVSTTIYVATDGDDDTGNGTEGNPYQTIAKAKEVVRTFPKDDGDIVVQIADGFYSIDEPLVFTSEDSGSENSTIRYEAAPGASPVISGGQMLEKGVWTEATELTQTGGLTAYKTTLDRDDKLRAIYVNDNRANMTLSPEIGSANRTVDGTPTVSFTSEDNPWAWTGGNNIRAAIVFDESVGLTAESKNPQNIEAESMGGWTAKWARPFITFASIEEAPAASDMPGGVMLRFQMPYGAISQSLSNNTHYNPTNNQVIRNAFEFLNKRGDFYFDQAESTLYYIPLEGEDINAANVVVPNHETIIDIRGIPVGDRLDPIEGSDEGRVQHITFDGLTFAHTDYRLHELTGTVTYSDETGTVTETSHGYASTQGAMINTAYFPSSQLNWHETFYRSYDIPPAAITINAARNIKVLNGEVKLTGFNGIHIENDVKDIEVTGNYIAETLASAIIIGHPTHVYENDEPIIHESSVNYQGSPIRNWAGIDKEKFEAGTEAVPEDIYITNNFVYRNSYGFPGGNALQSFYTTNMQVLHNHFYDTTYGAMSIGWGWNEFDGYGFTEHGANKQGGPYHGTHESSLARSPEPTTTSRNNKINYNRVEEIATVVNDTGAIYSLGRQGDPGNLPDGGTWDTVDDLTSDPVTDTNHNWHPDNWTNYTEMNYNYLDPNTTGRPMDRNNWTNGFHPDEASTFIKMIGNVVQAELTYDPGKSRIIEFNNWKRKSDMTFVDGYVDGDNLMNGAPRVTFDNYKSEDRIWPLRGHDIVLNSGLANEYVHMIPSSIIADTEFELASNVVVGTGGHELNRRGLLDAEDTVWLAPAGTTDFAEGETMTKAAGNETQIITPSARGEYKLYIVYANGSPMATSKHTLYVDPSQSAANVEDGENYDVSAIQPLTLALSDDFTFSLNGSPVADGHQISTEGSWTLVGTSDELPESTISFNTSISIANRLLTDHVTVAPGGEVRFAYNLNDPTKQIWISSASGGHFDGGDSESQASGDANGMKAPMVPGPYVIFVLAEDGSVLSQSHANVIVSDTDPVDPTVDKTLLNALIEEVKDKDFTNYTSDSWSIFASALNEAQAAASNDEIGQTEADNAYYALRDANKALQVVEDELQFVEVFNEDFISYDSGTGTLDDSVWMGQNNQVSVTENKELRFAPTEGVNIRAQTVDKFGDMELTYDFNVESASGDQGFYIYLRTTDQTIEANRNNKNGLELAINPEFWDGNLRLFEKVNNSDVNDMKRDDTNIETDRWYSSKIVIEEDMLYAKFWPRDSEEPTEWGMSGNLNQGTVERGEGHISFEFFGPGRSALIDNVVVKELSQPDESAAISGLSSVSEGQPVVLPIGIRNLANGFDTFSVEVNYDPEKLEFETVTDEGNVSLAESAITNLRNNWNIINTEVNEEAGEILIHASTTDGSMDQNGGKLLDLNATAVSISEEGTSISLSDFILTADGVIRNINTENAVHVVQVKLVPVTGISLNETEVTVIEGKQTQLTVTVTPEDAANKTVSWSSSDETIVTVDANGLVTAVKAGTATITVTTEDGGYTASVRITVDDPVDTTDLEKTIQDATDRVEDAVIGDELGHYPQAAVDRLEAAITTAEAVLADESADQAAMDVAVEALQKAISQFEKEVIPAPDLTGIITNLKDVLLAIGESKQLEVMAEFTNDSLLNVSDGATYSSSDATVVTVSTSGEITAIGAGEAQITILYQDQATQVNVNIYDTTIMLDVTVEVIAGVIYQIEGSDATIRMPADLPAGTTVIVTEVNPSDIDHQGYEVAGDAYEVNVTYPNGATFTDSFTLTLGYDAEQYADEDVHIYYFNEDTGEWELRGGDAADGVITLDVPHFSTYGVFAEAEQQPEPPVDEDKDQAEQQPEPPVDEDKDQDETSDEDKDEKLPKTTTSMFNWLAIGFVFVIAGAGLFVVIRRKYEIKE